MASTPTVVGFDGTVNETQWARLTAFMGVDFAVREPGDLRVDAVAGLDRTVRLAPGTAFAHGVTATFAPAADGTNDGTNDLQAATVASGSRWDLVVLRYDWQPPGGTVTPVIITGTSAKVIPTGLLDEPGVRADLPLALVRVEAGKTTPTAIVDLRVWHGNGGVLAADPLALGFLERVGSVISIGDDRWVCTLDVHGMPAWIREVPTRPITRAWYFPRQSTTPQDAWASSQGYVGLVGGTVPTAPAGWYAVCPVLSLKFIAGTAGAGSTASSGTLLVRSGSQEQATRADVGPVSALITPTVTYYHGGGDLPVHVLHAVSTGQAGIDNGGSGVRVLYLGP